MNASLIAQQAAPLPHLLRAGGTIGLLIVALGAVLTVWGVVNLLNRASPVTLVLQATCSLIPAVLGMAVAGSAYAEFLQIAAAVEPPKPVVFARLISSGLFAGMVGPLASVIPAALGIAGLARATAGPDNSGAPYEHA